MGKSDRVKHSTRRYKKRRGFNKKKIDAVNIAVNIDVNNAMNNAVDTNKPKM